MPLVQLLPARLRLPLLAASVQMDGLRRLWRDERRPVVRERPLPPPAIVVSGSSPRPSREPDAAAEPSAAPTSSVETLPASEPGGAPDVAAYPVTYRQSGVTLSVRADDTLLEAALRAGLDLAHACQMGMCGTCRSRLLRGEVEMDEPNTLSEQERARGDCLPCVSHPRGPVEVDA